MKHHFRELIDVVLSEDELELPTLIENCVLKVDENTRIDIGAICYKKRRPAYNKSSGTLDYLVVDSSLDESRRALAVQLFDAQLSKPEHKASTRKTVFKKQRQFIDYLDLHHQEENIQSIAGSKAVYVSYTSHLISRMRQSGVSGKPLSNNSASTLQKAARTILSYASGQNVESIVHWATRILHSGKQAELNKTNIPKEITHDDCNETVEALVDFIEKAHSYYLSRPGQFSSNSHKYETPISFDPRNERALLTKTMVMSAMSFMAVTGANLQPVLDLEIGTLQFLPTQKGFRSSGCKYRAKGKEVIPEFGLRYAPVFKKILELRDVILDGEKSPWLFVRRDKNNNLAKIATNQVDSSRGSAKLFRRLYPNRKWITARKWRNNKGLLINRVSKGDTQIAAEMLGHDEKTNIKHYNQVSFSEAAKELANFFNRVFESAIRRTRNVSLIPVKITDQAQRTMSGGCVGGESSPVRAEGFTNNSPAPNCESKENCLFCKHYAVHADIEDCFKLLSLRFIAVLLKETQPFEQWERKWGVLAHRIDEILDQITQANNLVQKELPALKDKIEEGELHPFWDLHLEMLFDFGVVT